MTSPLKNISRKGPRNCGSLHGTPHGEPGQGCAPNDTAGADGRFSAAPTALGSSSGSISQPFRAGLTFGGRPSGPCIYSDLCRVISPSTGRRQVSCSHGTPHGTPGHSGAGGMTKERVVQRERIVVKGQGRCRGGGGNAFPSTTALSIDTNRFVRNQKSRSLS
jgi:hypothetical protein